MKPLLIVALAAFLGSGPRPKTPELAPGVQLKAAGKPIDVEIGHAAPFYVDFDGDGLRDLLVGQFGGGKLRIYKNVGSNSKPQFESFQFFQAAGKVASVPYG